MKLSKNSLISWNSLFFFQVDGGLIVPVFANPRPPITPPPPPITVKMVGHIVPVAVNTQPIQNHATSSTTNVAQQMRVKLPSPSHSISSSHPCKNSSCEFYGTPELDYFCSKCSKKAQISSRWKKNNYGPIMHSGLY